MTTDHELEDLLIDALGPEPAPDITINAAGAEIPEDPDTYTQRYEEWRATFEPATMAHADHCARRYRQASSRVGEIDALARDQIRQIEEWAARQREKHERDVTYWSSRLELFHRKERAANPRQNKTIELPCGVTLRSQAGKIRVEVTDPLVALAWLENNGAGCVDYPPANIKLTAVAQSFGTKASGETEPGTYPAVSIQGEVVPGIELVRGETTYTIS